MSSLIGRIFGRSVHFVGQLLAARLLGPVAFGLYAVVWAAVRLLSVPAVLGLDIGVLHQAAKARADGRDAAEVYSSSALATLLWSVALALIVFGAAPVVASWLRLGSGAPTALRFAAVTIPAVALLRVYSSSLRSESLPVSAVLIEDAFRPALFLLMIVGAAFVGRASVIVAFVAVAASYWISASYAAVHLFRRAGRKFVVPWPLPSIARIAELVRWAIPVSATSLTAVVALQVDQFLLAAFVPLERVGEYAAAVQTVSVIPVALSGLDLTLGPRVAAAAAEARWADVQRTYSDLARWGLVLLVPAFAVLLGAPAQLLAMLFGDEFAGGASTLMVLSVGFAVNAGCGGVALVLFLVGQQRRWLQVSLLGAVINIAGTLLLAPRYGAVGAASAAAVSMAVQNLLGTAALRASVGVGLAGPFYVGAVSRLAVIVAFSLLLGKTLAPDDGLVQLCVIAGISVLSTALLLLAPEGGLVAADERRLIRARLRGMRD